MKDGEIELLKLSALNAEVGMFLWSIAREVIIGFIGVMIAKRFEKKSCEKMVGL